MAEETHEGQHMDCDPCFKIKLGTIQFSGYTPQQQDWRQRDRDFARDAESYRRLRKDGVQPRGVDKSYMAERLATHKADIELGRDTHPVERQAVVRSFGAI